MSPPCAVPHCTSPPIMLSPVSAHGLRSMQCMHSSTLVFTNIPYLLLTPSHLLLLLLSLPLRSPPGFL